MNLNDSGVAKWSVPFSTTSRASGSFSASGLARAGEVVVADAHQDRAGDGGQPIGGQGVVDRSLQDRGEGLGVVPRLVGVLGEQLGADVGVGAVAGDGVHDAPQAVGVLPEEVRPDTADHDAPEALGNPAGQLQQGGRAEGEADGVDLPVGGQGLADAGGQVGVGLGLVRLGRRAMAEEVDPDHRATGVLQEGLPARSLPGGGERPAPAVDQDHRFGAHGPDATELAPRPRRLGRRAVVPSIDRPHPGYCTHGDCPCASSPHRRPTS